MNILNIGPLEFILILVIMFIFLGPEGMVKTAGQIGVWIRKATRSPMWKEIMGYSREIRELPTKLVRESGLEDDLKEIREAANAATTETQKSIQEATQEINESIKEAGTVDIALDLDPNGSGQAAVPASNETHEIRPPDSKPTIVID